MNTPTAPLLTMGLRARTREAARLAWITLRTGRHIEAEALLAGGNAGMAVGQRITTDKFNRILGGIPAQRTGGAS